MSNLMQNILGLVGVLFVYALSVSFLGISIVSLVFLASSLGTLSNITRAVDQPPYSTQIDPSDANRFDEQVLASNL